VTLMEDIEIGSRARAKLADAAKKGTGVILTPEEVLQLEQHLVWLANEREELLSSGAFDD
jgi:hypothetical protein